jgi:hypothetical protein
MGLLCFKVSVMKKQKDARNYFHQEDFVLEDRVNDQQKWNYLDKRNITEPDLKKIVSEARKNRNPMIKKWQENAPRDAEIAVELVIKYLDDGKYDGKIDHYQWEDMVKRLDKKSSQKTGGILMANKLASKFDELAGLVNEQVVAGKMDPKFAHKIEYTLDKMADLIDNYGRQVQARLNKQAGPADMMPLTKGKNQLQTEADESYMKSFGDGQVRQQDADEWYMDAYKDGERNEVSNASDKNINESATVKKTYGPK